mmetsp:Transcript_28220/g.70777  ORF Transcript_28220/g.70777 Transcript_28220/m.70777 type:complete len:87 (+) Transcript_28220:72-332(+)
MKLFLLSRSKPDDFPLYASEWSTSRASTPAGHDAGGLPPPVPTPLPHAVQNGAAGADLEALLYRTPQKPKKGRMGVRASMSLGRFR